MTEHTAPERTETTDPFTLSDAAATALLREVPWRRLAVAGDSTAADTGDPRPGYETIAWPDRLARWLRAAHPGTAYLNTARAGAVLADVHTRQLPALEAFAPDLVHLSCGGNDLFLRGASVPEVEADLDQVCTRLTATGARLSLFTLADRFTGPMVSLRPLFTEFAEAVRRVAHRHDAILTEFWDHPARLRPDWVSADLIHLSMAGHAVAAAEIAKTLARHATAGQPPELAQRG